MKQFVFLFGIVASLALSACGRVEYKYNPGELARADAEAPQDATQGIPEGEQKPNVTVSWERSHENGKDWTSYVYNSIDEAAPGLVDSRPKDIENYCKNYDDLSGPERKYFWTEFVASMSLYESEHDPNAKKKESFKNRKSENVWSRGLLQLSMESANQYGCGFRSDDEVHDPYLNLRCGLMILNRWIVRDNIVRGKVVYKGKKEWRGAARYWAVHRNLKKSNGMKAEIKQSGVCN